MRAEKTRPLKEIWSDYHRSGDPKIREKLIQLCMPLIRHVVGKIAEQLPPHIDREDLMEAGIFGLIDAIERYDVRDNAKFETYAMLRARGAVMDELRSRDFVPRTLRKRMRQIDGARAALMAENDAMPTTDELAKALNIDRDELEATLTEVDNIASVTSLYDRPERSGREGTRMLDMLVDTKSTSPASSMEVEEKKRVLSRFIQELPEQERLVITLYYYEGMLLKEIGEIFNVTESRISQVRSRALMLLKNRMKQAQE